MAVLELHNDLNLNFLRICYFFHKLPQLGMPIPLQEMILGEPGDRGKGNFQPIPWASGSGIWGIKIEGRQILFPREWGAEKRPGTSGNGFPGSPWHP